MEKLVCEPCFQEKYQWHDAEDCLPEENIYVVVGMMTIISSDTSKMEDGTIIAPPTLFLKLIRQKLNTGNCSNALTDVVKIFGKGNECSYPPARSSPSGFEKNLHAFASLRVVFFPKTLHAGNTH